MSEEGGRKIPHGSSHNAPSHSFSGNSSTNIQANNMGSSFGSSPTSPMYLMDQSRRSSGNFSRLAFNIYGLSNSNSPNASSASTSYNKPAASLSILPSTASSSQHFPDKNTTKFQSNNEILTCAKSNETPNLFVIGGPKFLQLLKISNNEVSIEYDLIAQPTNARNAKFGLISEAKFGHQQYGRNIAVSTLSGSIHLYNLDRGNRIRTTLSDHQRAVNSIDFNHVNPYHLISGSQDGKMKLWDLRMKNTKASVTINGNADAVRCVQFNPRDQRSICSIFDSGVIQKWDIRKPNNAERRLNAHTGPGLTLDWHPELDYIISGGRDKQIQVWNMSSSAEYSREPDHVINTSGAVSKVSWCRGRGNGSIIGTDIAAVFLNDDPCIQIWNLNRKYIPKNVIERHNNQVTGLTWKTPKFLISCSKDRTLVQHDVTMEDKVLDNLTPIANAWDHKSQQNMMFIKQDKHQFEITNDTPSITAVMNATLPGNNTSFNSSAAVSSPGASSTDMKASSSSLNQAPISGLTPIQSIASTVTGNTFNPNLSMSEDQHQSFSNATSGFSSPLLGSQTNLQSTISSPQPGLIQTTHDILKMSRAGSTTTRPSMMNYPSHQKLTKNITSPFAVPVEVPLLENEQDTFEFLSSFYLIQVPDGMDIIQVCEYNATIAGSARRFRDCQTWRTIKASILWEISETDTELIDHNFHEFEMKNVFRSGASLSLQHKNASSTTYGTGDGTSQSDKLGTTLGSFSESVNSNSIRSPSSSDIHELNRLKITQLREKLETEKRVQEESASSNLKEDPNKVLSVPTKTIRPSASTATELSLASGIATTTDDNEDAIIDDDEDINTSTGAIEIIGRTNKKKKSNSTSSLSKYTYSFTGSSADFDNEKPLFSSKSPKSMLSHSFHTNPHLQPMSINPLSPISSSPARSRKQSLGGQSQLTAALKESNRGIDPDAIAAALDNGLASHQSSFTHQTRSRPQLLHHNNSGYSAPTSQAIKLKAPWNPTEMIKQATAYSAHQGDVTMCAVLTLLFYNSYPSAIEQRQAQEWVFAYYESLMARSLFGIGAAVLRCAASMKDTVGFAGLNPNTTVNDKPESTFEVFSKLGQTRTSVRLFCMHCDSLILNDGSKTDNNYKIGSGLNTVDPAMEQVGFWYCEKCTKVQGCCIYCNEPIKGTCVTLFECGHKGHFGCMKGWFVDQLEVECPGCGDTAM